MTDVHEAHDPVAVTAAFLAGIVLVLCLAAAIERVAHEPAIDGAPIGPPEELEQWNARELRSLPGVGEKRAVAIVRERWAGRISGSAESLDKLPGIGPETVKYVRAELARRSRRPARPPQSPPPIDL